MRRALSSALFVPLVLLLSSSASVQAQRPPLADPEAALPGTGWWMGQQVMNTGTANALLVSAVGPTYPDLENSDQAWAPMPPAIVGPGQSYTFLPGDFPGLTGVNVSGPALIQSDQPIRGILNLTNRYFPPHGAPGGKATAAYQGQAGVTVSTELYAPIAKNAFPPGSYPKSSLFFIENVGNDPIQIRAEYTCPQGGPYYSYSNPVSVGGRVGMSPAEAYVPTQQNCSAKFTSYPTGDLIAGSGWEYYTNEPAPIKILQATRIFSAEDYDDVLWAPVFKKKFYDKPGMDADASRTTGIQVKNVGSSQIDVWAYYYYSLEPPNCSNYTLVDTTAGNDLLPGQAAVFLNPTGMPEGCLASVKFVTSPSEGRIVGVENESYLNPVPTFDKQSATAFNLILDRDLTSKVVLPLYKEKFGDAIYGWKSSALYLQNAYGGNASVTIEFRSGNNTWKIINQTIQAFETRRYYRVNRDTALTWYNGSVLQEGTSTSVTILSDHPIAAVVNEVTLDPNDYNWLRPCYGGSTCYDQSNYEGFNLIP